MNACVLAIQIKRPEQYKPKTIQITGSQDL
jgi:hypothetical protein